MDFKTFLEHFDTIAQAPNGIAKLRSLILDLAVQGKLIASNLEKKDSPQCYNLGKTSYQLPAGWAVASLSQLVEVISGNAFKSTDFRNDVGIRTIKITNVGVDEFIDTTEVLPEDFLSIYSQYVVNAGDLLIALTRPYINQGLKVCICPEKYDCSLLNQRVAALKSNSAKINISYLYLYLKSRLVLEYIQEESRTMNQPNLSIKSLKSLNVAFPSLAEQKQIVEKVDELMALCDRYQQSQEAQDRLRQKLRESAIAALMNAETDEELQKSWSIVRDNWRSLSQKPEDVGDLRRSVLALAVRGKLVPQGKDDESAPKLLRRIKEEKMELIENKKIREPKKLPEIRKDEAPFSLPSNWLWVRMQEIFNVITDGDHQAPPQTTFGVPFLVISNVREGFLNFESTRFVSTEFFASVDENRKPIKGDLLYTVVGSYGIPVVVNTNESFFVQRHIALLKPSKQIEVAYLKYVLQSDLAFKQATSFATGIAQKTVPLNGLRKMIVPLPPLAEQKRIAAKVDELMQMCDRLEKSLRQTQQRVEALAASAINHLTV